MLAVLLLQVLRWWLTAGIARCVTCAKKKSIFSKKKGGFWEGLGFKPNPVWFKPLWNQSQVRVPCQKTSDQDKFKLENVLSLRVSM